MPTTGLTPASIVRLAKLAVGLPLTAVVSPVAESAIVKVPVVPISGFAPGVGFESVDDVPAPVDVKMYPPGSVNCAL